MSKAVYSTSFRGNEIIPFTMIHENSPIKHCEWNIKVPLR